MSLCCVQIGATGPRRGCRSQATPCTAAPGRCRPPRPQPPTWTLSLCWPIAWPPCMTHQRTTHPSPSRPTASGPARAVSGQPPISRPSTLTSETLTVFGVKVPTTHRTARPRHHSWKLTGSDHRAIINNRYRVILCFWGGKVGDVFVVRIMLIPDRPVDVPF